MADILQYDPHKAKKMVETFRKSGKVDIAKQYKEKPEDFLTRLNDASSRKFEEDFIEMYKKVAPNHTNAVREDYTETIKKLQYPLFDIPGVNATPVSAKLDTALKVVSRVVHIKEHEYVPDYEKELISFLQKNCDTVIQTLKEDVHTVTDFITRWAEKTTDPNVYIISTLATELRSTLIQYITIMVILKELKN